MAHNNFIIGYDNKIYRLKETGLYNLNLNNEYSDLNAKYLAFEEYTSKSDRNKNSEVRLFKMVDLANQLNCHLVLPTFPFQDDNHVPSVCNACGHEPYACHWRARDKTKLP